MLIAPVSHSWPGGVAWYYTLGARPTFGAPFRRLVTLPAGLLWMRAAVAGVFAPNAPPANFIEATRLPLVLRPMHFRANCEDVADAEAAVAALSPHYGSIRAPTEVVTGDSDGVVYAHLHAAGLERDIPGGAPDDAPERRPLASPRRANAHRRDHPRGRATGGGTRGRNRSTGGVARSRRRAACRPPDEDRRGEVLDRRADRLEQGDLVGALRPGAPRHSAGRSATTAERSMTPPEIPSATSPPSTSAASVST